MTPTHIPASPSESTNSENGGEQQVAAGKAAFWKHIGISKKGDEGTEEG